jgi:hypothetical protein
MEFVKSYFQAEKAESIVFIVAGCLAFCISVYLWVAVRKPFFNGVAFPLMLVALIQLTVGITVYMRAASDIERVENMLVLEPQRINTEELPRMETVMKNFLVYRYVELALIVAGVICMFYASPSELVKGIGLGLFIQASFMLAADYFAERRGNVYLKHLEEATAKLNEHS